MQLVEIKKLDLVTSTVAIADSVRHDHDTVMTAAKFRVYHDIDKKENIRDYLTPEQIHCVTELQRANTVLLAWAGISNSAKRR